MRNRPLDANAAIPAIRADQCGSGGADLSLRRAVGTDAAEEGRSAPRQKRVEPDPPKRVVSKPPRRMPGPPPDDDVVVVRRAPPPDYEPVAPIVGGFIGGGFRGGYGGGGYSRGGGGGITAGAGISGCDSISATRSPLR